jgi:hypothetical protein
MTVDRFVGEREFRDRSNLGSLSPFLSPSAEIPIRLRRTSVKTSGKFVKIQESRPGGKQKTLKMMSKNKTCYSKYAT